MEQPGVRFEKNTQIIKSYWFKTFSHQEFTKLCHLFYEERGGKKKILPHTIANHLDGRALAYWLMSDGSLEKGRKSWIIHSQGFSKCENLLAVKELNKKHGLQCPLIPHKGKYWVIKASSNDCGKICDLVYKHMIPSMLYKLP